MNLILFITFLLVLIGVYNLLLEIFHVPTRSTSVAIASLISKTSKTKTIDTLILDLAGSLSKYITLSEQKKEYLEASLRAVGIHMAPETYIARFYIKVGRYILLIFLSLILFPLLAPVFFLFAIAQYFDGKKELDDKVKEKKQAIEYELPRLANTISQEIRYNRDVIRMLENYKKNAGVEIAEELEITVADMKSGNLEMGLKRLESRISSVTLSQIVRGLIGIIRGDDGIFYFKMLSHDLRQLEIQRLRTMAEKQPGKIKKYSLAVVFCFMLIVFTALGIYGYSMITELGSW